ncbi:hypothetical protein GCM10008940_19020 [Microbulbifer agarilyticus]
MPVLYRWECNGSKRLHYARHNSLNVGEGDLRWGLSVGKVLFGQVAAAPGMARPI